MTKPKAMTRKRVTPLRRGSLVAAGLMLLSNAPAMAQHPTTYTQETSPGGIAFLHRFDAVTPYAAINLGRAVSAALPEAKDASYALIAGIIGQSADKAGSYEFAEKFNDLHASGNLNTGRDDFSLQARAPAPEIGRALKLLADAVATAEPLEKPYRRLRLTSERGLAEGHLKAESIAARTGYKLTLGDHPIVRLAEPTRYEATAHTDVDLWRKAAVGRDGLVVVASGRISAADAGKAIDAAIGSWPANAVKAVPRSFPVTLVAQTIAIEQPTRQSVVVLIGRPMYARGHEAEIAGLGIAPTSGGLEGRFGDAVRVSLGATYGVSTSLTGIDRDQRLLVVSMSVDTAKLKDSITALRKAYDTWHTDGVTDREMASHKSRMLTSRAALYADPAGANRLILANLLAERTLADVDGFPKRIAALTREQVNALIKDKFPRVEDLMLVVVTPNASEITADCVIKAVAEALSCAKK